MMTSSVFGAEQHISKWSSALAVQTRRHRKKNRATQNIGAERVSVFVKSDTYIHVLSSFATKVTSFPRGWPCSIVAAAHLLFISRSFNVIIRTYPQFYHDLITMRGAMPTHLGANPRNHVNHDYSCSSLENFYYYY